MFVVQKDMKDLKEKANSERIKAKMDARLVHLEKERDWFRAECLQLDKMNKDMKKLLASLKVRLETESEEKETLHTQLVDAKLINKQLMYELDQFKQQSGFQSPVKGLPFAALDCRPQKTFQTALDDDKVVVRAKPDDDQITVYQKAYNELLKENEKI